MAVQILKRPYGRCWSGNPIHYTLYSAEAEADASVFFEVKVLFKPATILTMDAGDFTEVATLPFVPVQGTAQIDLQKLLAGVVEHELPAVPVGSEVNTHSLSGKASGHFYIHFRQITTATPNPDFTESEFANLIFLVKGGISFEKWRGNNFWVNYFDRAKPFLTWEKNDALHAFSERMYLAWLNLTDVPLTQIKVRRTVYFTDGTNDVTLYDCPVPKYQIAYLPAGADQLELQQLIASNDKQIWYWELQMLRYDLNPIEPISETFKYRADNKNDYNAITLNYRNSLGGISSTRIRGVIEMNLEREYSQAERIVVNDYFTGHYVNGRVLVNDSREILLYKGDIGYMGKDEQERTRDLHFKREVWWEQNKKWMPVLLITNSAKLRTSIDKRFGMPVEFCIATGGDEHFTPASVNLEEEAAIVSSVCTAVITDLEVNYVPGTGWVVTWALSSGAPAKYLVSTPAINGGMPVEVTALTYTFPFLPVGDNVITVQPVCNIGGLDYPGTTVEVTATVDPLCVPVTIMGGPGLLPNAAVGVAYFYSFPLVGTAPFNLDSYSGPAWLDAAINGDMLEFSGTPDVGDVGSDIEIDVTVSNCSGSTATLEDTINVIDLAAYGEFILTNEATGLCTIKSINASGSRFYSLITGAIPVTAGNNATGIMTAGITNISVEVVVDVLNAHIKLFKNGVEVDDIATPGSGTYTFTSTTFLVTDDMEIKLVLI